MFTTVCCTWIGSDRSRVTVAPAGHPPPLLVAGGTVRVEELPGGPALGILDHGYQWEARTLAVGDGWTLLCYTDGLVEGLRAPGSAERFGSDALAETVAELLAEAAAWTRCWTACWPPCARLTGASCPTTWRSCLSPGRPDGDAHGNRSTEVVSSARAFGNGSTPRPGPCGTARWPSSSTNGAVTSWW